VKFFLCKFGAPSLRQQIIKVRSALAAAAAKSVGDVGNFT
tara:strand:+ start:778 stop:897 length:120 start_codon:yes stop_codon:yes gene_type:complete